MSVQTFSALAREKLCGKAKGEVKISAFVLKDEISHHEERVDHDEGVQEQHALDGAVLQELAGVLHSWISRRRRNLSATAVTPAMKMNIRTARADPCPKSWMPVVVLPKAVR